MIDAALDALYIGLIVAAALGICELILWIANGMSTLEGLETQIQRNWKDDDEPTDG